MDGATLFRTCLNPKCGEQFEVHNRNGQQMYCSVKCRKRHYGNKYRKSEHEETLSCERCGTEFAFNKTRKRFCSQRCRTDSYLEKITANDCSVYGCAKPQSRKKLCAMHYDRLYSKGDVGIPVRIRSEKLQIGDKRLTNTGYVEIRVDKSDRCPKGYQLEHRFVMEQHLGRELFPGENVHHINGDRSDNRLDNLELWSTAQPSGQRVSDKISWAIDFLGKYGYRALPNN